MQDKLDYKQAAQELLKDAKHGDPEAQCLLGQMYYEGLGVKQDYKQASEWLQKAAQQGNSEAQSILEALETQQSNSSTSAIVTLSEHFEHSFSMKKIGVATAIFLFISVALIATVFWVLHLVRPMNVRTKEIIRTMDVSEVFTKVLPATVFISVEKEKGGGTGSGFFAQNGKIFTNAHVVEDAKKITIKTHEGKAYDAEILDANKELDFAVLTARVPLHEYSNLEFTSEVPTPGSEIIVIGSPLGLEQTISNGLVSAVRHYDNDLTLLQITAPISPGSSGSPVVNMKGQVVGLATMMNTKGQNLNFAVSHTSVNRRFSRQDTYLVQSGVPIVIDDNKCDLLRVKGSKNSSTLESPKYDRVRILNTEQLEVRLIVKVRSENNGDIYWIDSNSVKQPIKMKFDEFLEKFNDGLPSSERLSPYDFERNENYMKYIKAPNSLALSFDPEGNIQKVHAIITRFQETPAEIHPFIQQTIKVFYPNSLIANSFFVDLLGMALESITISKILPNYSAQVEKFPVLFDMKSLSNFCDFSVFINDPDYYKQDLSKLVKDSLSSTSTPAENEPIKTLPNSEKNLVIPKPKSQTPKNLSIPGTKFIGKDDGYEMYLVTDSIEYDIESQLTSFLTIWWPTEKSKIQMRQDPYFYVPPGKDLGMCVLKYIVDFKANKYMHLRTINYCTDGETIARDYIQPDEKLIWRTPKTGSRIKLLMQEVKKARTH